SPDSAIDFPLRRRHVAVIAWAEDVPDDTDTYSQIELELRRLREMLPVNGESLLVPADEATIWAWFPLFAHTNSGNVGAAFRSLAQDSNRRIRYAIGSIESGGRGFRVSHTRAQLVRNVMVCADTGNEVGDFADSGMAVTTLLGSDVELARDWVA